MTPAPAPGPVFLCNYNSGSCSGSGQNSQTPAPAPAPAPVVDHLCLECSDNPRCTCSELQTMQHLECAQLDQKCTVEDIHATNNVALDTALY